MTEQVAEEIWDDDFLLDDDNKGFEKEMIPRIGTQTQQQIDKSAQNDVETWDEDFIFETPVSISSSTVPLIAESSISTETLSRNEANKPSHQRNLSLLSTSSFYSTGNNETDLSDSHHLLRPSSRNASLHSRDSTLSMLSPSTLIDRSQSPIMDGDYDEIPDEYVGFAGLEDDELLADNDGIIPKQSLMNDHGEEGTGGDIPIQQIYSNDEQHIGGSFRSPLLSTSGRKLRRSRSGGQSSFYGNSFYGGHSSSRYPMYGDADDIEDDWDSEMQINDYYYSMDASPAATVDIFKPNHLPTGMKKETNGDVDGSLLEYLESAILKGVSNSIAHSGSGLLDRASSSYFTDGTETEPDISSQSTGPHLSRQNGWGSFSTLSMKSFQERQENKFLESANQHLKGLFEWLDSTSGTLRSVIGERNKKKSAAAEKQGRHRSARLLLNSEIQGVDGSRGTFIERLLDLCEEEPTKETCINALEEIVRWIRSLCQTEKKSTIIRAPTTTNAAAKKSEQRPHLDRGGKNTERGNNAAGDDIFPGISKRRFEKIFSRCDYILNEQSRFTTGRILELHNIFAAANSALEAAGHANGIATMLGVEFNYYQMYEMATDGVASVEAKEVLKAFDRDTACRLGTMSNVLFRLLCKQTSLSRIQLHMLEIRIHVHRNVDMFSNLENLRFLLEELDTIMNTWLGTLRNFLPSQKSLRSGSSMDDMYDDEAYLMRPISFQTTDLLIDRVVIDSDAKQGSFGFNRLILPVNNLKRVDTIYIKAHADMLIRVINDLQALCVANKLLVTSGISPITYQHLFDGMKMKVAAASNHSSTATNKADFSKSRSSTHSNSYRDLYLQMHSENTFHSFSKTTSYDPGSHSSHSHQWYSSSSSRSDANELVKKSSSDSSKPSYNVVYEISIGNQVVDLMVLIPSGSMARSKLSYAAFLYLQCLKNDELPWQQAGEFQLISVEQAVQGYGDFKAKKEVAFGIDSNEIDLNSYQLTAEEVEHSIVQSFSELFRNLDEIRIHQLLLYEASVDLFPTIPSIRKDSGRSSIPQRDNEKHSFFSNVKNNASFSPSSDWNHSTKAVFQQVPLAMDLGMCIFKTIALRKYPEANPHDSNAKDLGLNIAGDYCISHSLAYELYNYSFALFYNLANSIVETSPSCALDLYELCLLLLTHLDKKQEKLSLQKDVTILAVLLERQEAAIFHGSAILESYQSDLIPPDSAELLYIAPILIDQYCERAQYELAVKVIIQTISILKKGFLQNVNALTNRGIVHPGIGDKGVGKILADEKLASKIMFHRVEFERASDPLYMQLGKVFLKFGSPDKAAEVLQALLSSFIVRKQSSMHLNRIISTLSWLFEAYFDMNNYPMCVDIANSIKAVRSRTWCRKDDIDLSVGSAISRLPTRSHNASEEKLLDAQEENEFTNVCQPEITSSTDASKVQKSSSFIKYIKRMFSSKKAKGKRSMHDIDASKLTLPVQKDDSDGKATPSSRAMYSTANTNCDDSNLTKHCITSCQIDLGALMARIYFADKKYVDALTSITPTIIGVELFVGGKTGSKDGISELGQLYFLRGKIQLEACKSSSNVSYPFQVGSSRLFSTIQDLYLRPNNVQHRTKQNTACAGGNTRRFARSKDGSVTANRALSEKIPLEGEDSPGGGSNLNFLTCKRSICYSCPSDLLWDAMKWFRRAWDLFHVAGDEISAAMSANFIAKCHLEPTFVPHVFFQIPLNIACNLSNYAADRPVSSGSSAKVNRSNSAVEDSASLNSISSPISNDGAQTKVVLRYASLEEVQRVNKFALDTGVESSHPLMLIDSYINITELCILQGNHYDALAFWYEAKGLFLHIFGDEVLVPIVRRASNRFCEHLQEILDRLVRFLWICERKIANEHLFLLDMHIIFSNEIERMKNKRLCMSDAVSKSLGRVLESIRVATQEHTGTDKPLPTFKGSEYPTVQYIESSVFKNVSSDRQIYTMMNDEILLKKIYDFGWRQYIDYDLWATKIGSMKKLTSKVSGLTSIGSMGSSSIQIETDLDKILQLESVSPLQSASILSAKYHNLPMFLREFVLLRNDSYSAGASDELKDETRKGYRHDLLSPQAGIPMCPLDPQIDFEWMSDSYCSFTPNISPSSNESSSAITDTGGRLSTMTSFREYSLESLFLPEFVELENKQLIPNEISGEYLKELDARSESLLIQRLWRCWMLIENSQRNYQARIHSMEVLRFNIRNVLRNASLLMHRLRAYSRQYKSDLFSFDDIGDISAAEVERSHIPEGVAQKNKNIALQRMFLRKKLGALFADLQGDQVEDQMDSKSTELTSTLQPISLQCRILNSVYVIHVGNLLMMYRPHSGSHHIQLFGGVGFKIFSNIYKLLSQEVFNSSGAVSNDESNGTCSSPSEPFVELASIEESEQSAFAGEVIPGAETSNITQGKHNAAANFSAHSTITVASLPGFPSESLLNEETTSDEDINIQLPIDNAPLSSPSSLRNSISRTNSSSLGKGPPAPVPLTIKMSTSSTQLNSLATPTNRVSHKSAILRQNSESSSLLNSNRQFQPSFEVQFSEDELKLLAAFTEPVDSASMTGIDSRRSHIKMMNNGILSFSVEFLRDSHSRSTMEEFDCSFLREEVSIVPTFGIPLTLFCSRRLQFAPWEALLNTSSTNAQFIPVARSLSLASLYSAAFDRSTIRSPISEALAHSKSSILTDPVQLTSRGFLGPHWHQKGVCCVIASDSNRRDSKGPPDNHYTLNCERGQISLKKALHSVFHSSRVDLHEPDVSSAFKSHVYNTFYPHSCLGNDFLTTFKSPSVATSEKTSTEVFPVYLPRNSGTPADHARFWDALLQKLSLFVSPKFNTSDSKSIAQAVFFPIVVFSYVNLIDLPDVLIQLLNQRSDAICVFVPEIAMNKLLMELLSSLQKLNAYNHQVRRRNSSTKKQLSMGKVSSKVPLDGIFSTSMRDRQPMDPFSSSLLSSSSSSSSSSSQDGRKRSSSSGPPLAVTAPSINVRESAVQKSFLSDYGVAGVHHAMESEDRTSQPNRIHIKRSGSTKSSSQVPHQTVDTAEQHIDKSLTATNTFSASNPQRQSSGRKDGQIDRFNVASAEQVKIDEALSVFSNSSNKSAGRHGRRPSYLVEMPVYHSLMAAVKKVQQEEAVNIAVFI